MTELFGAQDQGASEREELLNKWKDKTPEEVLNAKVESDLYIKTLERQKDELKNDYLKQREELLAKANLQDLVDRLNQQQASNSEHANEEREPKLDPEAYRTIAKEVYEETRIRERQESNTRQVQAKLTEQYGSNYQTVLRDTGLSDKRIQEIAAESPEAIYRLVGLNNDKKESFQTPPRSAQRNDSFAPKGQTKRTYSYYQEMKKTNPTLYLDPKIAVQMHNDVMEIGEAEFYGQS